MTILAETYMRSEFVHAVLTTTVVALITVKPLAAIGRKSILGWIDEPTAQNLSRLPIVWWVATPLVAMLLCAVMLPQFHPDSIGHLMAMALLTGLLAALLINLSRIDTLCRLLPDPLTGMLIASGLTTRALDLPPMGISLIDGLIGCILGYGLLWLMARLFRKFRDTEAMGRGDFAMSAGLGAWLGWQSIPMVWMVASLAGIFFAFLAYWQRQSDISEIATQTESPRPLLGTEIPFGPALALGAIITWVQLG